MSNIYQAVRHGVQGLNKNSNLADKVPIYPVVCRQWVSRASSNFLLVADGVGFAIFCVALMASSWFACALSDVCTAANGGPF